MIRVLQCLLKVLTILFINSGIMSLVVVTFITQLNIIVKEQC